MPRLDTYKSCNGQCVACMSTNISYGAIEIIGDGVYYPYTCEDCGHEGKEHHTLEYNESE